MSFNDIKSAEQCWLCHTLITLLWISFLQLIKVWQAKIEVLSKKGNRRMIQFQSFLVHNNGVSATCKYYWHSQACWNSITQYNTCREWKPTEIFYRCECMLRVLHTVMHLMGNKVILHFPPCCILTLCCMSVFFPTFLWHGACVDVCVFGALCMCLSSAPDCLFA